MTIQWGILSTAHINRRIIPAIRQSERGSLRAVASRNEEKSNAYASAWNIPEAYVNYEDLLDDKDINVVYISLPNHLHTEWIIKSLQAGKHVLCEKPMCQSLEELDAVEKIKASTGLCVMEGFMHLHHPQTHLWKSIIQSGRIGEIISLRSCFSFLLKRDLSNYRWNAAAGGGALQDVGVYPISLFQFLLDKTPVRAEAIMEIDNEIDLSTNAILDFGNGISGQFFVSFKASYSTDTIIHGSAGQLYISHPFNNPDLCKAHIRTNDEIEILDVPRQYLYSGEIENMHDVILNKAAPEVTLEKSREVLRTIQMLLKL